jgi:hypothetical protein
MENTNRELELVNTDRNLAVEVGESAAMEREKAEIQSAIISAKRFPRDEKQAWNKIMHSFERPSMAECAEYRFPRGGKEIVGPSIDCARELARCWGNIRFGIRLVSLDAETVHIKGYALDLESNSQIEMEDKFKKLIFRKSQGWVEPDERDLRELINRRGAICVRNAILQLLPPDFKEDACRQANVTLQKAARGEIEQSREEAVRRLVLSYDRFGVTAAMIEQRLDHTLETINAEELTDLRKIWKSISDGVAKREEFFELPSATGQGSPLPGKENPNDRLKAAVTAATDKNGSKKSDIASK